jgi:hypothetical protein
MPNAKIVSALGVIDGVNTKFLAGEPYTAGFTRYILNGRIHQQDADDFAWSETNPDGGEITVVNPPEDGDVVQLFIVDRRPTIIAPVQQLTGHVQKQPSRLVGTVRPAVVPRLVGALATKKLSGAIRRGTTPPLQGTIKARHLSGVLKKVT